MTLLYRISGSFAAMSFFGALFVIITFIMYKELRKHPTQLVFFLSICDLIFSLKYMVTSVIPNSFSLQNIKAICYLQAGFQQFFGLASIGWSGMISLNLILTSANPFRNTAPYSKFYHIWVWGLSSVSTIIIFCFDQNAIVKSGDGTCWLENKSPMRLTFFIPLMAYFAMSIGSLITAYVYSGSTSTLSDQGRRAMLIRMSSYTAVFILCWLGPLIHRTFQWTQGNGNNNNQLDDSWLMYFDAIGVSIQGFMNAMVWLTNPQFFKGFTSNLKKVLPCIKITDEENIPLLRSLGDESTDPTQLATSLRNYILTCCLKGISLSVHDNRVDIDALTFSDINSVEEKTYTEKDLFREELSNSATIKKHQFKDYTPKIFAAIRQFQGISANDYLRSFNATTFFDTLTNQKFSEGKSGSFMCFTPDNQYLIKTITAEESRLLRKKMIKFYDYFRTNRSSYLLKFYGSYKVVMPNRHYVYLAVMSNVFSCTTQKIQERYDIKGSSVNRGGKSDYDKKTLGLDLDFVNVRQCLQLPQNQKEFILHQLQRDAEFLQSLNIMDYSLLIGIHENKPLTSSPDTTTSTAISPDNDTIITILPTPTPSSSLSLSASNLSINNVPFESSINNPPPNYWRLVSTDQKEVYYIGIIDILQLYDFSKKQERFLKVYLTRKNGAGISAAPPDFYKDRFMKRMNDIIGDIYYV